MMRARDKAIPENILEKAEAIAIENRTGRSHD
jgi:hypothetical protein